jgi:hypothetical protein
MPGVMHAPEVGEKKAQSLQEEQPQVRGARGGFWPMMVVQSLRRYSTHRLQSMSSADRKALRQLESPMARLAQEHPMLYLLGFFGMNNG